MCSYVSSLLVSAYVEYLLPFLYFGPMCIFKAEVSLLWAACSWIFFIHPAIQCLLVGEFSLIIIRVIINRRGLSNAVLSFSGYFVALLYLFSSLATSLFE